MASVGLSRMIFKIGKMPELNRLFSLQEVSI